MRVTFVVAGDNLSGGVRIIARHAKMLSSRGHSVHILCGTGVPRGVRGSHFWPGTRPESRRRVQGHLDLEGLSVIPIMQRGMTRRGALRAHEVPDADVIIATWWETAEWIRGLPPSKGRKINFLQHYEAHPEQPKDRVDNVWRLPFAKIVVSEWLRTIAIEQFDSPDAILVPNGIDLAAFPYKPLSQRIRGTVGTLASGASFKRFEVASESISLILRHRPKTGVRAFGHGTFSTTNEALNKAIEIAPPQHRIAEIYTECDCWIVASSSEGFGLPVLEAMASGTPVVATSAGAAPELLSDGGGRIAEVGDAADLARLAIEVLDLNDQEWSKLSETARRSAEEHSWERVGATMENTLAALSQ